MCLIYTYVHLISESTISYKKYLMGRAADISAIYHVAVGQSFMLLILDEKWALILKIMYQLTRKVNLPTQFRSANLNGEGLARLQHSVGHD